MLDWGLVAAWMGVIYYLSAQPRLPLPPSTPGFVSYAGHVVEYAVLAALICRALGPGARMAGLALAAAVLYGASDELHQSFVPGRSCSLLDVAADAVGAAMVALLWARTRPALGAGVVGCGEDASLRDGAGRRGSAIGGQSGHTPAR
jgi:hypothetical protein